LTRLLTSSLNNQLTHALFLITITFSCKTVSKIEFFYPLYVKWKFPFNHYCFFFFSFPFLLSCSLGLDIMEFGTSWPPPSDIQALENTFPGTFNLLHRNTSFWRDIQALENTFPGTFNLLHRNTSFWRAYDTPISSISRNWPPP